MPVTYFLKSIVCFNGGHYVTFVHNIKTKLDYVLDPSDAAADFRKVDRQLKPDTEWTLFDDSQVIQKPGGWKEIITDCVAQGFQPTVLLYEMILEDDKNLSQTKGTFEFSNLELHKMLLKMKTSGVDDDVKMQEMIMK